MVACGECTKLHRVEYYVEGNNQCNICMVLVCDDCLEPIICGKKYCNTCKDMQDDDDPVCNCNTCKSLR